MSDPTHTDGASLASGSPPVGPSADRFAVRATSSDHFAWLRTREVPVIPIIGARRLEQLKDNLASLTLALSPAQAAMLDQASAIELGFPNHLYSRDMVQLLVHAGMRKRILA